MLKKKIQSSHLKETNIKGWWDEIKGLSEVRCTNNCTQQMLSDQLPSFDALEDRFNTFNSHS